MGWWKEVEGAQEIQMEPRRYLCTREWLLETGEWIWTQVRARVEMWDVQAAPGHSESQGKEVCKSGLGLL